MTNLEDNNSSPRDISPAKKKNNAEKKRDFGTLSYRKRNRNRNMNNKNNNINNNGNANAGDINTDHDDELSRSSTSSTEKKAIAIPTEDVLLENSLSKELMKLSINDRMAIEEEIHGVSSYTQETPELLALYLHEFDKELMSLKLSMRRRRKLERTQLINNNSGDTPVNHDGNDVFRNVIRITPDRLEAFGEECTASVTESEHAILGENCTASATKSEHEILGENRTASTTETEYTIPIPTVSKIGTGAEEELKRSCYVNDSKVRLRFLRAELYDPKKAVKRFIGFLEFSRELFGNFVADRPIRLSDLKTREEKRILANAPFQFMPFRDRSGRRVHVYVGTCGYDIEPKLRLKVLWYMYWTASEDIESQRKGVVVVSWPSDKISNNNFKNDDGTKSGESEGGESTGFEDNTWKQSLTSSLGNLEVKALNGIPIKIAAVHICFEDRTFNGILSAMFYFVMNSYLKSRYKVHTGKPLEIRYKLQGFGIPVDLLPLTHTMTYKRQNLLQWVAFRKLIEQQKEGNSNDSDTIKSKKKSLKLLSIDPIDLVECPRSYDVIIGKAKYTNNPGNVYYKSLIEASHDDHTSLKKKEKVELTWNIVRHIEEHNGRFLEFNKFLKSWVHIKNRDVVRQKVAQSYKEFKRNAAVIRNKRNSEQPSRNIPEAPVKRQKTILPPLPDFLSGYCNENDDDVPSKSMFTAM